MVAKKQSTTKKTTAKKDESSLVKSDEKQKLIADLKATMHDLGRLPGLVVAPVIAYVSSKYEKIPAKRREKLAEIVHNLREEGTEGLVKLKDRFVEMSGLSHDDKEATKSDTKSKTSTTKTKTTPTKKATPTASNKSKKTTNNKTPTNKSTQKKQTPKTTRKKA